MQIFDLLALLVSLAALFSFLNYRLFHLPTTIGVMLTSLLLSIFFIALSGLGISVDERFRDFIENIDFEQVLLRGMLSFMLFAGALHVNLDDLAEQKGTIAALATGSVVLATILVGVMAWGLFALLGLPLGLIHGLLFGALISPTDPIAVLGLLKKAGVPKSLEIIFAGEALFNDGVGVVVFTALLGIAASGGGVSVGGVALLFLVEAVGGVAFGLGAGYLAYWMLKRVDDYQVEVLITLALVAGGYSLAGVLHVSGPIAMVVAGLLIGNHGRRLAMSEQTRHNLDTFWELADGILNAILFLLIGFELLVVKLSPALVVAGLATIPMVLLARFLSVGIPVTLLRRFRTFSPHVVKILTWGGLRGGISVALALSLPRGLGRDVILAVTYAVVVFSILVQGLTVGPFVRWAKGGSQS
jgi:monovalent cation:H+ antiporter, CPA1 family